MPEVTDRRKRRSSDPIVALHYQLEAIRRDSRLEALVLVDESGFMVAGAGAWPVCEEVAAYAPLLATGEDFHASYDVRSARVHSFRLDGATALLCAQGEQARQDLGWIERSTSGCQRSLSAQA